MATPWDPSIITSLMQRFGVGTGVNNSVSTGRSSFDTPLPPDRQQAFQAWRNANVNPQDSGGDYDFQGAYLAGLTPSANGHWVDTFKKPNEPTFSNQSQYAKDEPGLVGHWNGDQYQGPQSKGTSAARLRLQQRMDSAPRPAPTNLIDVIRAAIAQHGQGRAV